MLVKSFLVALVVTVAASSDRQSTFSLKKKTKNLEYKQFDPAQKLEKIDLNGLKQDWEGEVIFSDQYPNYAVRIKEPKLCDKVQQYSGYLDTSKDKHFFFWFFESRGNPSKDPLVLWLNGGPGCSSLTGLLMELGPCKVNKAGKNTTINPESWNKDANVIFLDQPINTGFSYGSPSISDTAAASYDVYAFLQLFFKQFPKYRKLEFHIFGESYAGVYIPEFARLIFDKNQNSTEVIKLKSVGIGNGHTDPLIQYEYYPEMACNNSYGAVLTEKQCSKMRKDYPLCKTLIKKCYDIPSFFTCAPAARYCDQAMLGAYFRTGMNPYDVRKKCGDNDLCYDIIGDMEKYLNHKKVKKELGARSKKFESCSNKVNAGFSRVGDEMRPYVKDIEILLEGGVRVLIYAGDADFICNWIGNKAWTMELPWSGHEHFVKAKDLSWRNPGTGKIAGEVRHYKNFAFVRVFEAGHMVPYDQPENALYMFRQWIMHESF